MHKTNNFDSLRLLFSVFVIITHSYPLSGIKESDWLHVLSDQQISFSSLGVKGFFVISGYLIYQSLERSNGLLDFYWKRIIRIFPGLIVVLLLTILLAPIVYDKSKGPYWENSDVWSYIPNNLSLYRIQMGIKGIFENNPYKFTINGSLWTIPYEFTFYLFMAVIFLFKRKHLLIRLSLIVSFALMIIANVFYEKRFEGMNIILNGYMFLDLGIFFVSGALLASFKIEESNNLIIMAFTSWTLIIISLVFHNFYIVRFFTLPVFIISIGLIPISSYSLRDKVGDLSYGIYIYGFPIQQTIQYYFQLNCIQLIISSLFVSAIFAYFSWHLIESKAMKLKNMFIK